MINSTRSAASAPRTAGRRLADTGPQRQMRVHWSVQSASRDAILRRINAERAASLQTRRLACEADPELFFDDAPAAQREAQRMCWDCPVRRSCLRVGLDAEANAQTSNGTYSNGTIGGVTAAVRERLVRARRTRRTGRGAGVRGAAAAKVLPGARPTPLSSPPSETTLETTSRSGTRHAAEAALSPSWTGQTPHLRRSA